MAEHHEIPEAAVEALAEVLARIYTDHEDDLPNAFKEAEENLRDEWRGDARGLLTAALPAIHADLRERLLGEDILAGAVEAYKSSRQQSIPESYIWMRDAVVAALDSIGLGNE